MEHTVDYLCKKNHTFPAVFLSSLSDSYEGIERRNVDFCRNFVSNDE